MRRVPSSVSEARTRSSGYLFFILLKHLLQLHALAPVRTIAHLCTPRSTKLPAQDLLHGPAHLRLEPQCDSSGFLLRAFQDQLVVHREQKVGAGAGIRCQLLEGEVEDVSGSGLDRAVEPFGVLGLAILIWRSYAAPPEHTACNPLFFRAITLLPLIELRERCPKRRAVFFGLCLREFLTSILIDILPVALGTETVEKT